MRERGKRHYDREGEREKEENLESQENTESEIEGEKKREKSSLNTGTNRRMVSQMSRLKRNDIKQNRSQRERER